MIAPVVGDRWECRNGKIVRFVDDMDLLHDTQDYLIPLSLVDRYFDGGWNCNYGHEWDLMTKFREAPV